MAALDFASPVRPRLAREKSSALVSSRHYRAMADGFLRAVDAYIGPDEERALADAILARDRGRALNAVPDIANPVDRRGVAAFARMVAELVPPLAEIVTFAADRTARDERFALSYKLPPDVLKAAKSKKPKFAPTLVTIDLDWVRKRAAQRVVEIGREQRESLRRVLEKKFDEGLRPNVVAKEIKRIVGLTSREAAAVDNRKAELQAKGVAPARIERETQRYSEQLLDLRAQRIARTEAVTAETQGKLEAWRDAADDGLISGSPEKEWVSNSAACPKICKPMDGERVGIDECFLLPDGQRVDGPVAHPHCECSLVLRRGRI